MLIRSEFFTLKEFIWGLLTLKQGWLDHLWFMEVLIGLYIIFPLLKLIHDRVPKLFQLFVILSAFFLFVSIIFDAVATLNRDSLIGNISCVVDKLQPFSGRYTGLYFCVGGLVYDYKEKILLIPPRKRNALAIFAMTLSCCLLWLLGIVYSKAEGELWDVVWNGYNTIMTCVNVLAIFIMTLNYKKGNTIIQTISINTLGIYFIHVPLIVLFRPLVMTVTCLNTMWCTAVFSIFLIFVCIVIANVIKRIPIIRHLII